MHCWGEGGWNMVSSLMVSAGRAGWAAALHPRRERVRSAHVIAHQEAASVPSRLQIIEESEAGSEGKRGTHPSHAGRGGLVRLRGQHLPD
jgi:hypothetical protein